MDCANSVRPVAGVYSGLYEAALMLCHSPFLLSRPLNFPYFCLVRFAAAPGFFARSVTQAKTRVRFSDCSVQLLKHVRLGSAFPSHASTRERSVCTEVCFRLATAGLKHTISRFKHSCLLSTPSSKSGNEEKGAQWDHAGFSRR